VVRGRIAVVELQRVRPAREVRIAPVGEQQVTLRSLDPRIVLGRACQVRFRSVDVVVGVGLHPGMIETGVVGDEIEEQPEAACVEPLAKTGESGIPSELAMNGVTRDGKTRTWDVCVTEVRQCFLKFLAPLRVGAGDAPPGLPGLPDAQAPDPVETPLGEAI